MDAPVLDVRQSDRLFHDMVVRLEALGHWLLEPAMLIHRSQTRQQLGGSTDDGIILRPVTLTRLQKPELLNACQDGD